MEAFLERMDGLNPCHMSKCEVALSFAGEQRLYVEAVARTPSEPWGLRVLR